MTFPWSPGIGVLLALLAFDPSWAQVQERKLFDRIMRPDTTMESPEATKRFSGADSFASKSFATREHYSSRSFPMRSYSTAPNREGSRKPFFAKSTATLPDSSRHLRSAREASRTMDTKTVPVEDARESDRNAAVRENRDANREYRGPEAQKIEEQQQQDEKRRRKFSIDELRDLLNKSK